MLLLAPPILQLLFSAVLTPWVLVSVAVLTIVPDPTGMIVKACNWNWPPPAISTPTTHCERTVNSVPSHQDVLYHLDEVRHDWFSIGLVLWVKMAKLREIEQRYMMTDGTRRCLAEMIQCWLETDPTACWERLVRALEQVDQLALAATIKKQHLWESSELQLVHTSHDV